MYDPTVGRFITLDPIGFDGADANAYRYVGNSPTNFTDPTGLMVVKITEFDVVKVWEGAGILDGRRFSVPSPHEFVEQEVVKSISYKYFANQGELDAWKDSGTASKKHRVTIGQLKGDQAALAGAAAGNPSAEQVATILNCIENTRVRENIPFLQFFFNERFGSICASWGETFNMALPTMRVIKTRPLCLAYEDGQWEDEEHFIVLLGVGGRVFGVDQGYYGENDHIFDISVAINNQDLTDESKAELQQEVQDIRNAMQQH